MHRLGCWRRLGIASLAAFVALPLLAPSAGAAPLVGWSQVQGDPRHAGYAPDETVLDNSNVGGLQEQWRKPLPPTGFAPNNGTPVVANGTVYIASGDVAAFDAVTGAQRWRVDVGGVVPGTPALIGGLLLVVVEQRGVLALDAATGATVWERRLRSHFIASITAIREQVFLTVGQTLFALRLSTGHVMWSTIVPGCSLSTPTAVGDLVIVGGGGASVSAYDSATGAQRWSHTFNGDCGSSYENWLPAVRGSTVYAGLVSGVAALDVATGNVLWFNQVDAQGVFFPMAVAANSLVVGQDGGDAIVALDRSDGSFKWRNDIDGQAAGMTTFGSLTWVVRSTDTSAGELEAFEHHATGRRVLSYDLGPVTGNVPPVVVDGRVYVSTGTDLICLALP